MSPDDVAARSGCFAVRRGQAHYRADVNYNSLTYEVEFRLATANFPVVPISSFELMLQYGCSVRATEERVGVPILRMNNLQADGWDLRDIKYITLTDRELARWRLAKGDVVFNRTNSKELVGKCEVFEESGDWVFASYLMRLRVDPEKVEPAFLAAFLNTKTGRTQINRESRQIIGMSNINAQEIRTLRLPLPEPPRQREMLDELNAARSMQREMAAKANKLIGSHNGLVLDALGIRLPDPANRQSTYAVKANEIAGSRIDPHFYRPDFRDLVRSISAIPSRPLGALIGLSHEAWSPSASDWGTFRYIEISSVNPATGEISAVEMPISEAPSRARMLTRQGDIVVSLTRPHRGAIGAIDAALDGCVASTGFAVLRGPLVEDLDLTYLLTILRCQTSLLQMQQRCSGGNYPAITEDELQRIMIPLPEPPVQARITAEIGLLTKEATRLRGQAKALWAEALHRFEGKLIGNSPSGQASTVSTLRGESDYE